MTSDPTIVAGVAIGPSGLGASCALLAEEAGGIRWLASRHVPIRDATRRRLRAVLFERPDDLDRRSAMRGELADVAEEAFEALLGQAAVGPDDVAVLGLTGPLCVAPSSRRTAGGAACELIAPGRVARSTGVAVAAGFALSDVQAGGLGGPMSAWGLRRLFADKRLSRVVLHLGALMELVFLPTDGTFADVVAFDVGPGACLVDAVCEAKFDRPYDDGGAIAARGRPSGELLHELLAGGTYRAEGPGLGRLGELGPAFGRRLDAMAARRRVGDDDLVATLTEAAARAAARAIGRLTERPHQVILTGGGAKNIHLAGRIRERMSPTGTLGADALGVPGEGVRGACAALLALARLRGRPLYGPQAGGAEHPYVPGTLFPPRKE